MPQRRSAAVRKLTPTLDKHDGEGRMPVAPLYDFDYHFKGLHS